MIAGGFEESMNWFLYYVHRVKTRLICSRLIQYDKMNKMFWIFFLNVEVNYRHNELACTEGDGINFVSSVEVKEASYLRQV